MATQKPHKKSPWWVRLLRKCNIIIDRYDDDFGQDVKFGIKFKTTW